MYGLFQTSFYFGYMAVFSTALGIMCGEFQIFWQFSNRFFSDSYFWLELVVLECICLQDLLKKSLRRIPRVFCLYLVPTLYRRFLWIVSSDRKIIFVLCREFHPLCNLEKVSIWQEILQNKFHFLLNSKSWDHASILLWIFYLPQDREHPLRHQW